MNKIKMVIRRQCPMCGKIDAKEIEIDDEAWMHYCCYGTKPIQNYFPDLTPSEREYIKTGYCYKCQDILFAPPEEEE